MSDDEKFRPCRHCNGTGKIEIGKLTLGEFLKQLREEYGYTLRDVESMTGLSNPLISQIETGKVKNPGINTLYQLSNTYGVNIEELAILAAKEETK